MAGHEANNGSNRASDETTFVLNEHLTNIDANDMRQKLCKFDDVPLWQDNINGRTEDNRNDINNSTTSKIIENFHTNNELQSHNIISKENSVNDLIDSITRSTSHDPNPVIDHWQEIFLHLNGINQSNSLRTEFFSHYCQFMRSKKIVLHGLLNSKFDIYSIYQNLCNMKFNSNTKDLTLELGIDVWYKILVSMHFIPSNLNLMNIKVFYETFLKEYLNHLNITQNSDYRTLTKNDTSYDTLKLDKFMSYSNNSTLSTPSKLLPIFIDEKISHYNEDPFKQIQKNSIKSLLISNHLNSFSSPCMTDFLQSTDTLCRILAGNLKNSQILRTIDTNHLMPILLNRLYIILHMYYCKLYGYVELKSKSSRCTICDAFQCIPRVPGELKLLEEWFKSFCIHCLRKTFDVTCMPDGDIHYLAQLSFMCSSLIRNLSFFVSQIAMISKWRMLLYLFVYFLPLKQLAVPNDDDRSCKSSLKSHQLHFNLITKIQDDCLVILANIAIDIEIHSLDPNLSKKLVNHFLNCLVLDSSSTENLIKIYLSIKILSMLASNSIKSSYFILKSTSNEKWESILQHIDNIIIQNDILPIQELCMCFLDRLMTADPLSMTSIIIKSELKKKISSNVIDNESKSTNGNLIDHILNFVIQMNKKVITLSAGLNNTASSSNTYNSNIHHQHNNGQSRQHLNYTTANNNNNHHHQYGQRVDQRHGPMMHQAPDGNQNHLHIMSIQPLPSWSIMEKSLNVCLRFSENCLLILKNDPSIIDSCLSASDVIKDFFSRISERIFYLSLTSCILSPNICDLIFKLLKNTTDIDSTHSKHSNYSFSSNKNNNMNLI